MDRMYMNRRNEMDEFEGKTMDQVMSYARVGKAVVDLMLEKEISNLLHKKPGRKPKTVQPKKALGPMEYKPRVNRTKKEEDEMEGKLLDPPGRPLSS